MAAPPRTIAKIFTPRSQKEGAGFIIRRSIGSSELKQSDTDPYLMLDELPPTNYAPGEFPGAPWHPHRGMDTVMYNKQGTMCHEDSMGNKGVLRDGDCQWMTAASGIEHNEGTGHPGGMLHGFQCWINLPAAHKMDPPAYRDMRAASLPTIEPVAGVKAIVIAGECAGKRALVQPLVPVQYIDFMSEAQAAYAHELPDASYTTCVVHVYEGSGAFGPDGCAVTAGQCILFSKEAGAVQWVAGADGLKFLLLAGVPLNEPVVWHGPFVMSTQAQIKQCFTDYQTGKFIKHKAMYRQL